MVEYGYYCKGCNLPGGYINSRGLCSRCAEYEAAEENKLNIQKMNDNPNTCPACGKLKSFHSYDCPAKKFPFWDK